MLFLFESDRWVRRVYTDGRKHDPGYPITWFGHATGRWDGETLVTDTVDINDKTWIDSLGHPHSEALHVVERIRRVVHDTLQIDFTFEDPNTYTRPWTGKKVLKLRPADFDIMENVTCDDEDWAAIRAKQAGTRRAQEGR